MQVLKRDKEGLTLKKKFIIGTYTFLLIGILIVGTSYAVYQQEDEVQFINARVRWPKANEITYTTTINKNVKNVEQALNDLYEKLGE